MAGEGDIVQAASSVKIGITCSYQLMKDDGLEWPRLHLCGYFLEAVFRAGATPVLIPPAAEPEDLYPVLTELSGLIMSGGSDVSPWRYGAAVHAETKTLHPHRELTDFTTAAYADEHQLPVLAICCGIQQWNVHRGGSLHQHLPDLGRQPYVEHRRVEGWSYHPVRLKKGSLIQRIVGTNPLRVNSSHHQGLDRLGWGLVATAWAEDGLVEAVEDPGRPFCLGVQWHPEYMPDDALQRQVMGALVAAARRRHAG